MKYLLQRLISPQTHTDQATGHETELSALIVWMEGQVEGLGAGKGTHRDFCWASLGSMD